MIWISLWSLPLTDPKRTRSKGHSVKNSWVVGGDVLGGARFPWWLGSFPNIVIGFNGPVVLRKGSISCPFVVFDRGCLRFLQCESELFGEVVLFASFSSPNTRGLLGDY